MPPNSLQEVTPLDVFKCPCKTLEDCAFWKVSTQENQRKRQRVLIKHISILKISKSWSMTKWCPSLETSNLTWRSTRKCKVKRISKELKNCKRRDQGTVLTMSSERDILHSRMLWKTWMMLFVWFLYSPISLSIKVWASIIRTFRWLRDFMGSGWTIAP
jgi:hypothetical protein